MKRLVLVLVPLALGLLLAGCGGGGGGGSVSSDDVAVVGGVHIKRVELDRLLGTAERSYKLQNREFPKAGSPEFKTLQDQALQTLVQRAQLDAKAEDLGVAVSPKKIDDRLVQIKKQYFGGSDKRYEAELKRQGVTDEQVRQDIRAQLVSEAVFEKVTAGVKVTDAEIKAYYDQHPDQYTQPESREVRHILVKVGDKALADRIESQLRAGGDFAALAKQHSIDPGSKAQGGKLTISRGQTVKEFDAVAFSLKTNEISQPVKTQFGWHIIQPLGEVKKKKTTPLAQVREAIRQQLLQQRKNEELTKWFDDVKKEFTSKTSYAQGYAPVDTGTTTAATTTTG